MRASFSLLVVEIDNMDKFTFTHKIIVKKCLIPIKCRWVYSFVRGLLIRWRYLEIEILLENEVIHREAFRFVIEDRLRQFIGPNMCHD